MTQTAALWGLPDPDTQSEFYADVPTKRFVAWIFDAILIGVTSFVIALLTLGIGFFFFFAIVFCVSLVYRIVSLANKSATPGMRMVSVELRTFRGEKFDFLTAVLHTAGYLVSVSVFPLQLISIILMLTSARKQGLTDMILGTAAINKAAMA